MLRHERDVFLSLGAAMLGSVCQTVVPLVERQIVDDVILRHTSPLWPWLVLLVALAGGELRLRLRPPLPRRPGGARRAVRPAQRHARPPAGAGLRQPRPDADRAAGRPGQLGLDAGPGPAQLLPDHERQRPADGAVARRHALPVAAARPRQRWSSRRALLVVSYRMRWRVFPATWDGQQREGDVAQIVDEDVNGVRVVKAFGQEDRELERVVDAAQTLYGSQMRAVRLQARYQPLLEAIPTLGAGRDPGPRRLAGPAARDHARHLPRLLDLRRPAHRAGPPAGRRPHRSASRPGPASSASSSCSTSPPRSPTHPTPIELPALRGEIALRRRPLRLRRRRAGAAGRRPATSRPASGWPSSGRAGAASRPLAMLVSRFYDPTEGTVSVDGHDLRDVHAAVAAPPGRRRLRGELPLLRLGARQHRLRPARRDRRRDRGRGPGGAGPRVHQRAAARLRHRRRRARADAVRRPAAADRAGPGDPLRPAHPHPRRRHQRRRRPDRGGDPRRAARRHGRPHHAARSPTAARRCTWPIGSSCSTTAGSSSRAPTTS